MAQGDRSLDFSIWLGAEMYSGLVAFVCKDCLLFSPFFLINFIFPSKFLFFLTFICVCACTHVGACITACM